MENTISIIIPAYNAARFIGKTVESVLCQTYRNWELILVNDGSKDDTGAVIDTIASTDERIMASRGKIMITPWNDEDNIAKRLTEKGYKINKDFFKWSDVSYRIAQLYFAYIWGNESADEG